MPFLAPLIGAAIGGVAATAVGTAAIEIGLAFGVGAVAKSLAPKQKRQRAERFSQNLSLEIGTNLPRRAIIGRAATGGRLTYWQMTGSNNEMVQMIVSLADHRCHGLAEIWVDGKKCAWNAETGVVSGFNNKLKIRFYHGTASQTADAAVVAASDGRWTVNDRGIGVCYAVVEATVDETVFKSGMPQIVYVVDGALLYDPRKDSTVGGSGAHRWNNPATWEFSDNNAVAIYNVLRSVPQNGAYLFGLRAPADTIRLSDFEAAASACDEAVAKAAGGSERRYRCGFYVDIGAGLFPERQALDYLIEGMAGDVITTGGLYRILAGVAQPSVATLSDDDFVVDETFAWSTHRPRTELTNAIVASYTDPLQAYKVAPLPIRRSSADEEQDGGNRWTSSLDLTGVLSRTQAQRVMEFRRREARRQLRGNVQIKAKWFTLEPGDWITVNSDRAGWSGRTFKIGASSEKQKLATDRALIEIDSEVDNWSTSDEIDDDEIADLPSGGPTLTTVAGFEIATLTYLGAGGQQKPALYATWVPVTDPTVVQIEIRYRKEGDTVWLKKIVLDPSEDNLLWTEGVQGGLHYEAQARLVTVPLRATDWTAISSTVEQAPQQIVGVAQLAYGVPPGTISPEELSAQARFELWLVTATDEVLGSMAQQVAQMREEMELLGASAIQSLALGQGNRAAVTVETTQRVEKDRALAQQITTAIAQMGDIDAAVQQEITARVEQGSSLAQLISTATSQIDEQRLTVQVLQQSWDGIAGRVAMVMNANGHVIGYASLDGDVEGTNFTVAANRFQIALLGTTGGAAVSVFAIRMVNGVPKLALRADMLADGDISARHISSISISAIQAAFNSATFGGIVQSANTANGKLLLDFANPMIELMTAS